MVNPCLIGNAREIADLANMDGIRVPCFSPLSMAMFGARQGSVEADARPCSMRTAACGFLVAA
jgi:hypothetical protein